ncbi:MAG: type II toxin-antitoxin system VapB family antitoxin [Gammaproteobacteria bacterium]|nr:type II toxin-antitoxin system VapB family antitoxin [Gammaproteobacteria bacterium]
MRTNIEIDNQLMNDALRLTGLKTKKAAVDLGLRTLIRLKHQERIRQYRSRLEWVGNLDEMRSSE